MSIPGLLRVWECSLSNGKQCSTCRRRIQWGITHRGRYIPLAPEIAPLRLEVDDKGRRFLIYEPLAKHDCRLFKKANTTTTKSMRDGADRKSIDGSQLPRRRSESQSQGRVRTTK